MAKCKCKATYFDDCFQCEFSDCVKAESDRNKIYGEPSVSDYLPDHYIAELRTQKTEGKLNGR